MSGFDLPPICGWVYYIDGDDIDKDDPEVIERVEFTPLCLFNLPTKGMYLVGVWQDHDRPVVMSVQDFNLRNPQVM